MTDLDRFRHDFPSCAKTYATLCIYHQSRSPDEITQLLNVQPDRTIKAGTKLALGFAEKNGWFWSTEARIESRDLGFHVDQLIATFENSIQAFNELHSSNSEIRILCFWASVSGNGGPVFDQQLLRDLSALPVELHLDVWSCGD